VGTLAIFGLDVVRLGIHLDAFPDFVCELGI
jgi:hypothetical protein